MTHKTVIVIGGGISGLSFARQCVNTGRESLLLEKTNRLGGCIEGYYHEGLILEYGTHTMYRSYTACYEMLSETFRANHYFPSLKFRYFVDTQGSLTAFWRQFSLWGLFSLPKVFFTPRTGQTLSSYFSSIFGEKNNDNLFNPAFDALYCQPSADYPLALLFKKRKQNKIKQLPKSFCYQGGMMAVVNDIASSVHYRLNQKIDAIAHNGHHYLLYADKAAKEPVFSCDVLVIAAPATEAVRLLSGLEGMGNLPMISPAEFASMSIVHKTKNSLPDSGLIGWKSPLLSAIFARRPPGTVSDCQGVTCHYRDVHISDEEAIDVACRAVGIEKEEIISYVRKHNQVPALRVSHLSEIKQLSESLPVTLGLSGNYFGGFSIEDCIQRSRQEFNRLFNQGGKT